MPYGSMQYFHAVSMHESHETIWFDAWRCMKVYGSPYGIKVFHYMKPNETRTVCGVK